CQQYNSNPFTF
nr:immunoglobulin light chain junction region [Macaca mulatta]MOV63411.1 immunoglobulin light chain junction region [Macaca mulatta]MOV64598.1 immunoglobulin light chain junction region [Macaca mulatta]MOV65350.1 immunoglobulin light chain junction region [Macaca mulatta]MOV79270.1 immunoglobulin light chain junction region [Macaca mulatta]